MAGINIGKRKYYCLFINLRGYKIREVFSFSNKTRYCKEFTKDKYPERHDRVDAVF
ncbi:MAG: hypothetical protein ACYDIA_08135 [Candidatus Humimicrobiaceae bacterium]